MQRPYRVLIREIGKGRYRFLHGYTDDMYFIK